MTFLAWGSFAQSPVAQVFTNQAPAFGITAYDWNGHYGAAVSTADWNDDERCTHSKELRNERLRGLLGEEVAGGAWCDGRCFR